ncbi:MAG: four helix bundle protein [Prevotella sp.]|nr:four helix bundle protein [Prevotella sp.]
MLRDNLIADMTENFALRIIEMYRYLRKEKHEYVMSLQIYRSGTSIGANISESKNAQSKADFVSKLSIALKEAGETEFWLKLLYKSQTISEIEYNSIQNDLNIIIGTLVKIIKKTKENMEVEK